MVFASTFHFARLVTLGLSAAATLIGSASQAQVELKTYADEKGYINVRALTCAQLANTYQEDANFLGVWYSGWWNGHITLSTSTVPRKAFTRSSSTARPIRTRRSSTLSTPT